MVDTDHACDNRNGILARLRAVVRLSCTLQVGAILVLAEVADERAALRLRDDEVEIIGEFLRRDEEDITLRDARLLQAIIWHVQQVRLLVGAEHVLRERVNISDVPLAEQGSPFMDAHEHRHRHILALGTFIENVDGPRLRRIALDHAIGFEA